MHNFQSNYDKILKVLKELDSKMDYLHQIGKPKLRDKELIAIDLTSEYIGIDSECQLFRTFLWNLSAKIERSVHNLRKRRLFYFRESLRKYLVLRLNQSEQCYIIDSIPLEICKLWRSSRSKICKEKDYSLPKKGYCASQASNYYGYKIHAVCSAQGVIESMDISQASVHDINYLKDIKYELGDCTLLGDRGYLSADYQLNLFENYNIKLETPMRTNQHNYKEQPYIFKKSRKRIETLFSQLCDQSFEGFKNRILSKITAMTVIQ